MHEQISVGLALVLVGAVLNGSFAVPMKRASGWHWENIWLVYAVVGMILLPWMIAFGTIPHLMAIYHGASWHDLLLVLIFGFAAGTGSMLFGLGIARLGLALGFALILGICASLGSLLPMVLLHPERLLSREGYALFGGTLLVVLGIVLCSIAGQRRERETMGQPEAQGRSRLAVGLVICIASGVLSAMLNFAFVFGKELQSSALSFGASPSASANTIWALALTMGFIANGGYCLYLMRKNRSWGAYSNAQTSYKDWLGGVLMGLLWFGSIVFYGMGAVRMGSLGGIVGWPIYMAMIIVIAYLWGVITGEWAKASRAAFAYACSGIGVLLVAIYVISLAAKPAA
ncbi:MAG TPA: L-rhamnose/proton symporter RhaT [Terriglobia bacterium]|nr:L-rhamnose/proton symporter RhaT [Terriglobia bacterium]